MNTIIGIYCVFFLMGSVSAKSADAESIIYRHPPKDKPQETEQADSDNVRYQHLSIDDSQGTVVDKIIGLEEEESEDSDVGNLRNEIQRLNREHQKDRYGKICSCTPDRNCHTFCLGDKIASHPGVLTQAKKIRKTLK